MEFTLYFHRQDPAMTQQMNLSLSRNLRQVTASGAPKKKFWAVFYGILHCMQLPDDKVTKIRAHLIQISQQKLIRLGKLEKLNCHLMHATIGIPNGRGLLSPLIATIATKKKIKIL